MKDSFKDSFEIASEKGRKKERSKAYMAIGTAWNKMRKAGYSDDLNLCAIMHELQQKFKEKGMK